MTLINDRIELTVENNIAHVVLSRPDKMNALDQKMFAALIETAKLIDDNKEARVVVMSAKGKGFCAGLDMENFAGMLEPGTGSASVPEKLEPRTQGIANDFQYAVWAWRELQVPVIAALHGVAVGGGLQIALAADMRYAAEGTRFSIMELKWGLIPDMSSTQLMRHHMPEDAVRELTYTARLFSTDEALQYQVVTKVVEDPLAHAMDIAEQIANRNPDAIRASKRVLNSANYLSAAEGLLMESREQDQIIGSANQIEAVMAELQKRKPNFID